MSERRVDNDRLPVRAPNSDGADGLVDPMVGLSTLSAHANVDLGALDLDGPVGQVQSYIKTAFTAE